MRAAFVVAFCILLSIPATGCRYFGGEEPVLVDESRPIAYIKRPYQQNAGSVASLNNPVQYHPGSDLFLRDLAIIGGKEKNITGLLTKGVGDVSGPEPSYDGRTIVFSMRCSSQAAQECANDDTWNIWTYDLNTEQLNPVISDFTVRNMGDDLDPVFLPDGRIAFISNRQQASQDKLGYRYVEDNGSLPAVVLHVMNRDGTRIEQLSFSQSHERNPVVMDDGRIMFSRWDESTNNSRYSLFTIHPDGGGLASLYGAHGTSEAILHARQLADGRVIATVLPTKSAWEGGAIMLLDVKNFSEEDSPAPGLNEQLRSQSGQTSATIHRVPIDDRVSRYGRYSTPFPIRDGKNNVLVSYSFYSESVDINLNENDQFEIKKQEVAPKYGLYMLNIQDKSLLPLVQASSESIILEPIALSVRSKPQTSIAGGQTNPGLFSPEKDEGLINIRSVYDTDRLGYMGTEALSHEERALSPIPLTSPFNPLEDNREKIPDLAKLKDPAVTTAAQRPAWFLRVIESQFTPPGISRTAIGETGYGMRRISGYAPIEPDGSVQVKVPANRSFTLQVVDRYGRAFQAQSSWLHVLPGETLQCKGCHSPRDNTSINQSPVAGSHRNTSLRDVNGSQIIGAAIQGESMAETRARLDPASVELRQEMIFSDVWTDDGVRPRDQIVDLSYAQLLTPAPTNGVINFKEHIAPLFTRERTGSDGQNATCSFCHNGDFSENNPSGLTLGNGDSTSGRSFSYEKLLMGEVMYDTDGYPMFKDVEGVRIPHRQLPLVTPGYARGSYLIEKIFNQELFADRGLPDHGLDHSGMMTAVEKRLLSEWVDMGAQFVNSPFDENGNIRSALPTLDFVMFGQTVKQAFEARCIRCHSPYLASGEPNGSHASAPESRFDLIGEVNADFNMVASYVNDVTNPPNNPIIAVPMLSELHPLNPSGFPYVNEGDSFYNILVDWIATGQQANGTTLQLSVPYALSPSNNP
ncbi:MAG: hypothetical protein OEZ43_20390 [Gammaproteobacteria bacterium]|nr:hypothetical protein [Gammaproteobacteria bacterium]